MMRSLFSAVSGLRVHQTKLDAIANNVSNINTTAFKSSRVTFAEIFAETLQRAMAEDEPTGRGGVNPIQVGLGATVASIDTSFKQGAAQQTDRPYDLMISGDGFFVVGDVSGLKFTRNGAFNFDSAGNLVNSAGLHVYGWQVKKDANDKTAVEQGPVTPLAVTEAMRTAPPTTTKNIDFTDNLNAVNDAHTTNMTFYDSLGYKYVTDVTFAYVPEASGSGVNVWSFTIEPYMHRQEKPDEKIDLTGELTGALYFDDYGKLIGPASVTLSVLQGALPDSKFGDADGNIKINFTNLTQYGEFPTNAKSNMSDGKPFGVLQDVSIGGDGVITGRYSNGDVIPLGQIPVAVFDNAQGLSSDGNGLYMTTANSGEFDGIGQSVQLTGGKIMAGALEMSNVELAQEFTEMITTQRGFQANSRIISVSDDILQELINLKR